MLEIRTNTKGTHEQKTKYETRIHAPRQPRSYYCTSFYIINISISWSGTLLPAVCFRQPCPSPRESASDSSAKQTKQDWRDKTPVTTTRSTWQNKWNEEITEDRRAKKERTQRKENHVRAGYASWRHEWRRHVCSDLLLIIVGLVPCYPVCRLAPYLYAHRGFPFHSSCYTPFPWSGFNPPLL